MSSAQPSDCPFCLEFSDVEASEFRALVSSARLGSRIYEENDHFVTMAGLGAFSAGYIMLLPVSHVRSFALLRPDLLATADDLIERVSQVHEETFGRGVMFEHGSMAGSGDGGGCIDHAHIHWMRTDAPVLRELRGAGLGETTVIDTLLALPDLVGLDRPYILCRQYGSTVVIRLHQRVPSQFMRRLIARLEGHPMTWDWATHPQTELLVKNRALLAGCT